MYQLNPEFVHVAAGMGMLVLVVGCALDWWDKRKSRNNLVEKAKERSAHTHSDDDRDWLELLFDSDGREWGDN